MPVPPLLPSLLPVLHLIPSALWTGSAFYLWLLHPRKRLPLEASLLHAVCMGLYRKFFLIALWCLPITFLGGVSLGAGQHFHFSPACHLMIGCWIIMSAATLWGWMGPFRRLHRALRPVPKDFSLLRMALLVISLCGILGLACGAVVSLA